MIGLGACGPLVLVVCGEHDDVLGHDASFR